MQRKLKDIVWSCLGFPQWAHNQHMDIFLDPLDASLSFLAGRTSI